MIEDPPRSGDTPIRRDNELPKKPRNALFHSKIKDQQSSFGNPSSLYRSPFARPASQSTSGDRWHPLSLTASSSL